MSATDPFPRERFGATLKRVPAYARLAWNLAREPLLSKARRAAVIAAAGYLVSPVDAVPGVVPVLGQLDDLAVAFAAIKLALAGLSPDRRRLHLETVGLSDTLLAEDVRNVGITTAWLVRAGGRTTARAARAGGRVAAMGTKAAVAGAGRAMSGAAELARRAPDARVRVRWLRRGPAGDSEAAPAPDGTDRPDLA